MNDTQPEVFGLGLSDLAAGTYHYEIVLTIGSAVIENLNIPGIRVRLETVKAGISLLGKIDALNNLAQGSNSAIELIGTLGAGINLVKIIGGFKISTLNADGAFTVLAAQGVASSNPIFVNVSSFMKLTRVN